MAPLLLCRAAMALASHFKVLVVREDGRSIRRLNLPRWVPTALTVGGMFALIVNAALVVDNVSIRRQHIALSATRDQLELQARQLAPLKQRLAELRDEMTTWDGLHNAV